MQTRHRLLLGDARALPLIESDRVNLVVTSPPYPMIEMWDEVFAAIAPDSSVALRSGRPQEAFEVMHLELDRVWAECVRVLAPGGLMAINIGDATRTIDQEFRLYPNHARILQTLQRLGLSILPDILWRKPNNSPTKFLGSGMLPGGAYVTYEHEYILVARKGSKRAFNTPEEKARRRRSAYFWEERNVWFSDVWMNLVGVRQAMRDDAPLFDGPRAEEGDAPRERSAAYPLELALRLIRMWSCEEDVVLDPFVGTGTTMTAAAIAGRSSVGVEIADSLAATIGRALASAPSLATEDHRARIQAHRDFVVAREASGRPLKHRSPWLDQPVMTAQEVDLRLPQLDRLVPEAHGEWIGHYA